jgi:hypothetical protein
MIGIVGCALAGGFTAIPGLTRRGVITPLLDLPPVLSWLPLPGAGAMISGGAVRAGAAGAGGLCRGEPRGDEHS